MAEEKPVKQDPCDEWTLRFSGGMPLRVLRDMISEEKLDCICTSEGLRLAKRPEASAEIAALCGVKKTAPQ
jgi:hypothetical protein